VAISSCSWSWLNLSLGLAPSSKSGPWILRWAKAEDIKKLFQKARLRRMRTPGTNHCQGGLTSV